MLANQYWKPRPHVSLNVLFKHRLGANFLRESYNTPSKSGILENRSRLKAINVEENCHGAESSSTCTGLLLFPRRFA